MSPKGLPGSGAVLKADDMLLSRRNAALGLQSPALTGGNTEQAQLGQNRHGALVLWTTWAESCSHTDTEPDWPRRPGPELKEGLLWTLRSKKTHVNSSHLPREGSVNSLDRK